MASQIMNGFTILFGACGNWLTAIMYKTGLLPVYFVIVAVLFAVRFLLAPIFGGSAGSDKASSNRKEKIDG